MTSVFCVLLILISDRYEYFASEEIVIIVDYSLPFHICNR